MTDNKSLIEPIKQWLLSHGKCVGCGQDLAKGSKQTKKGIQFITCSCRRVFTKDLTGGEYKLFQDSWALGLAEEDNREDEKFISGYYY